MIGNVKFSSGKLAQTIKASPGGEAEVDEKDMDDLDLPEGEPVSDCSSRDSNDDGSEGHEKFQEETDQGLFGISPMDLSSHVLRSPRSVELK